jgi:DNA invertase Pin-like site-specific DNA recombinase
MAGLLSVFAQFERDLLSERVRAGIAEARRKASSWDDRSQPLSRPVK